MSNTTVWAQAVSMRTQLTGRREGIEDLTGGVNFGIEPQNILDKDRLWKEFLEVNKTFLFGCAVFKEECDAEPDEQPGLVPGHAYTVLEARELQATDGKDCRLLKIRFASSHHVYEAPLTRVQQPLGERRMERSVVS